jgi:uncharacterized protein YbaP (TraB family)
MTRISFACCLLALCIVSTCSYSQQTLPKSLLWRITGKGLKQPSYLYGTIHLTDKRLFNLGDSVYRAIEKSEGLAIEVNPDEMGAYYVNKAIDEAEGTSLQQLLNEKDFKKYSGPLSKKFKKPASEITTGDIVAEKNKWLRDYMAKGEMPTFLDGYLYNIARRQGKWVGGVEDISDQAGLLDQLVDKSDIDFLLAGDSSYIKTSSNKMMERMVNLYCNQDLAGIEAMISAESPEYKDLLLIKRNIKMARRIDSLTALRTMFIAIGSAHLPGDSGVIQLLQKRGFTVEPVFSSKKLNAKDYTFKEVKLPWLETEDKDGLYKVSLPGNAANVKIFGLIEMKFFTDLFTMSNYATMAVVSPRKAGNNKDSLFLELAQRIFRTQEKLTGKKVFNNGIEGKEYQHTVMGEKLRLQAFMFENVVYVAFMTSLKQETLLSADAEHFFSSFTITKKLPVSAGAKPFVDSVMGIAFMTPAELTYNKKLSSEKDSWHVSGFTGTDFANNMYIFLFSKDIAPGSYLNSDTLIQKDLIANLTRQYAHLKIDTIQMPGYRGIQLQGANSMQAGLYMQAVSLIRNNRNIVLMVVTDSLHLQAPVTMNMFSSIHYIPPPARPWNTYTSADSTFSALMPGPFRTYGTVYKGFTYSFDTTTASSYYVRMDTLSKYTWFKNDSLFWKNAAQRYARQDSLVSETDINYNGRLAKELLTNHDYSYRRMRLFLHDDNMYEVFVLGDKEFVINDHATAFLNSFTIHTPQHNKDFITQSKAAMLLHDLASKDSSVRTEASQFLEYAQFDRQDVPALHRALLQQYLSSYSDTLADEVNLQLATIIARLKDTTTVTFIKEQYPSLIKEKEYLRNTALATLAKLQTKESYDGIAQLLDQYGAPAESINYHSMRAFKDTLSLVAPIFSTLQKQLAKDSANCTFIADLALTLKDSGYIKQEQIAIAQNNYIEAARKFIPAFKKDDFYHNMSDLLQVIGSFNSTAGNNLLKSYLSIKDLYVKKSTALQLIKNKQPVPAGEILKLAADTYIRTIFYEDLKGVKKTSLFPQQYATQQAFGESAVYQAASDDYSVKKITFLTKMTAKHKGKNYTFYLYRVILEDEEPAGYLGIAGFTTGSTSLEVVEDLSGIYWEEAYKESKVNSMFKAFLESR